MSYSIGDFELPNRQQRGPEPAAKLAAELERLRYGPPCDCRFETAAGKISNACVQKRDAYHCTCLKAGGSALCPFVLMTIDNNERKPDGTRAGTKHCVDRTRSECDPLDKAMPASCNMLTITQVKGSPAHESACQGYVSGLVEGDPKERGVYKCSICDWAFAGPNHHGKEGDLCTGFDGVTGKQVSGVLDCPNPR